MGKGLDLKLALSGMIHLVVRNCEQEQLHVKRRKGLINMMISEVSKQFSLSADTLRYYERIGLIPAIKKNQSGNRHYCDDDLKWIEFVKCMRKAGLPIDVLVEYLALYKQGDETIENRRLLLIEQRKQLVEQIHEMQVTCDRLSQKIDNYDNIMLKREEELLTRK